MFTTFFILNHGVEALGALLPILLAIGVLILGAGFTALVLLIAYLSTPTKKRARNLMISGGIAFVTGFLLLSADAGPLDYIAVIFLFLGALSFLVPSFRKPL